MGCQWKEDWSALNLVFKEGFMLKVIFEQGLERGDPSRPIKRLTQGHRQVKMMFWITMPVARPFKLLKSQQGLLMGWMWDERERIVGDGSKFLELGKRKAEIQKSV